LEEPTDQATEEADPDAIPSEYPDAGLEFTNIPDLDGKWRRAFRTYIDYERGVSIANRDGEITGLLTDNAAENLVTANRRSINYRTQNDIWGRGITVVDVKRVERQGRVLLLELCADLSGAWSVVEGVDQPPEEGFRLGSTVLVRQANDGWRVLQDDVEERDC
jgi:hypothetical protein